MPSRFPLRRLLLAAAGLLLLTAGFVVWGFRYFSTHPAGLGGQQQLDIPPGASLATITADLERRGLIFHEKLFRILARLKALDREIKAGEYLLSPQMTPLEILEILTQGRVVTHPVTLPEGFTLNQIARVLQQRGLAEEAAFIRLATGAEMPARYGIRAATLEGYLYPDTYHFARSLPVRAIADAMVQRFREVVGPLQEKIDHSGLTLEEIVTLASIVEKETGRADERPLIAGVFLNRLRRGMRLESDPTVIYGIEGFDGNLTREHLRRPGPYNTYLNRGLPPGPIANPGRDSILAVLEPAETDHLYFVARNDGSHQFSETLAQHQEAVNRFQRKRAGP